MSLAGSPSWATKSTVALAYAEGGIGWRIREVFGTLEIASISSKGEPLIVKDLAVPFDSQHTRFRSRDSLRRQESPNWDRPTFVPSKTDSMGFRWTSSRSTIRLLRVIL